MDDTRLIHFHLFKNGGSTFDSILKTNFGDQFSEFHGPNSDSSLFESDILNFVSSYPHIKAVSSHHFRFPVNTDSLSNIKLFPVVFIRHPVDRIYSIYAHEQRVADNGHGKQDFKSWLACALDERPYLCRDAQTCFFADGGTYYEVPDVCAYERAKVLLDTLEFCGVVNAFNLSMAALEDLLSKKGLKIDASYQTKNITPDRHHNLSVRLEEICTQAGNDLFDRLLVNNLYDLQLYDFTKEKLYKQIGLILK